MTGKGGLAGEVGAFPPPVSRETLDALRRFLDLVLRWTKRVNLIGPGTVEEAWDRHVADSLRFLHAAPAGFRRWADLGSGGGFPGLVVAIAARGVGQSGRFTMVEADRRKAEFLRHAAAEFALDVTVISDRIETVPGIGADVVSARALAAMPVLLGYVSRHVAPDGVALLAKGGSAAAEIAEAEAEWEFATELELEPAGSILRVRNIRRKGR